MRAGHGAGRGAPRIDDAQMERHPAGSPGLQWLNRRDASVRPEDSISLCQRALQIVTELCVGGHVDREKCSDIFPLDSNVQGKGYAGKENIPKFPNCLPSAVRNFARFRAF